MENMGNFNMRGDMAMPQQPLPAKKKSRAGIIIACIFGGLMLIALIVAFVLGMYSAFGSAASGGIDVIRIEGEITSNTSTSLFAAPASYNHEFILNTIDELIEDPSSKGIMLYLNTPGGGVYESDEVYLKLMEYKQTGRPIYAYMGQTAASGGYYIASASDKIMCNRNTMTGSIGVIMGTYIDLSGFLDRYGITTNTFTSGANKSMGSQYTTMTDEQKAIFQSIVDEAYEQFVGVVAAGRKLDISEVKRIADGRVYTAKQALANHLVDTICTYDEAVETMKNDLGGEDISTIEHYLPNEIGFASLFSGISKALPKNEAEVILQTLQAYNKTGYYCPELAE